MGKYYYAIFFPHKKLGNLPQIRHEISSITSTVQNKTCRLESESTAVAVSTTNLSSLFTLGCKQAFTAPGLCSCDLL